MCLGDKRTEGNFSGDTIIATKFQCSRESFYFFIVSSLKRASRVKQRFLVRYQVMMRKTNTIVLAYTTAGIQQNYKVERALVTKIHKSCCRLSSSSSSIRRSLHSSSFRHPIEPLDISFISSPTMRKCDKNTLFVSSLVVVLLSSRRIICQTRFHSQFLKGNGRTGTHG